MIIVSGQLYVDEADRDTHLHGWCFEAVIRARQSTGCLDFYVAADPVEADRINVYELWDSVEAVEAFRAGVRGSELSEDQLAKAVRRSRVLQYEVASATEM